MNYYGSPKIIMIHKDSSYAMFPSKIFNAVKFRHISLCKLKQIKSALPSLMIINHIPY